ncbi:MAG: phosphate ABC transporter permease subunit PstC [Ardenticatenaceae bacterium]|nr:phosphate ABC transporter permease subunit PstC [Ardenticatenaceae bacterium]MCB8988390.1 phosphate ABC transporter permease subunit PstC [Ardenticatenaceae bacterium]
MGSGGKSTQDAWFQRALALAGASVLIILAAMLISTAMNAWPVFTHSGWSFITSSDWDPGISRTEITGSYGALSFILGTLITSTIALLIAVPLAIGCSLYLTQIARPSIGRPLAYAVDLLAAVPSVVYGLWGLLFFVPIFVRPMIKVIADTVGEAVPFLGSPVVTYNYATAGIVLAIMVLPIITAVTREVMLNTPIAEIQGAYALGSTRWEMIRAIVLPRARPGIIGATMLGLGRALGETVAVAMLIGGSQRMPTSLFQGGQSMAGVIAITFQEASPENVKALLGVGVVLFVITVLVNMAARLVIWATGGRVAGDAAV